MHRQAGDVERDSLRHASSSGSPLGQNQPISVAAIGIEPHTTPHGEKIDQISMIVVAMDAKNGQIEFRGNVSRASGLPSATLLTITSRRSMRRPSATASAPRSCQSGSVLLTTGI